MGAGVIGFGAVVWLVFGLELGHSLRRAEDVPGGRGNITGLVPIVGPIL